MARMRFVHRTLYNIYTTESDSFQKILYDRIVAYTDYETYFGPAKLDYLPQVLDET
ncbi:hypothetical protein [Streptococcus hyointestinalis]|uniref:hypothetical protein n=1 Tax=Streptococcus hyointestinalis TaxID=1337 RepID=UPI0013DE8206|nr:hypothetical protein [Streptococcus hyointestinalis]